MEELWDKVVVSVPIAARQSLRGDAMKALFPMNSRINWPHQIAVAFLTFGGGLGLAYLIRFVGMSFATVS
jgi:hypothetical protein